MTESISSIHERPRCRLIIGDVIGNTYTIVRKLGSGKFADIWLAKSHTGAHRAIKIYRPGYEQYFENEIKIFTLLKDEFKRRANKRVVSYIESFPLMRTNTYTELDGDVTCQCNVYLCTVMNALGEDICSLLDYVHKKTGGGGLPITTVKSIMRNILDGLIYIHGHGVVHADIKPENILLTKPINCIRNNKQIEVVIADVGSAVYKGSSDCVIGTFGYTSPEITLDLGFDSSTDIWSAACVCFELLTGDMLFDYNNLNSMKVSGKEPSVADLPSSSSSAVLDESSKEEGTNESFDKTASTYSTTQSSSSEDSYDTFGKNATRKYKSLILMRDLLGPMPRTMTNNKFHTETGELIFRPALQSITTQRLLMEYGLTKRESAGVSDFISTGLKYEPVERATAEEWRKHPWLTGKRKK